MQADGIVADLLILHIVSEAPDRPLSFATIQFVHAGEASRYRTGEAELIQFRKASLQIRVLEADTRILDGFPIILRSGPEQ
ncbi:hypothetical protein PghCCS26_49150 [Paenibacillus glycanilyticus]|uniref:Uncharacterized protein n=1 Tax=Paenibacillus glycanilyticus TaxID=126569 RepID=A0ABQ6NTA1_9BACL|nr:hypothetical protein PghCCS26_49150 [Paenibacillus glycanilyticus]